MMNESKARRRVVFIQSLAIVLALCFLPITGAKAQQPAPAQPAPAQPAPAQPDPAQPDPAQPDPAQPAPAQPAPAQPAEAAKVAAVQEEQVLVANSVKVDFQLDVVQAVEGAVDVEVEGGVVDVGLMANDEPQIPKLHAKVAVDNALVRRICKPDAEQLKQLERLDMKWVKENAAVAKQEGANFALGVLRVFAPGVGANQPDKPADASKKVTAAYKARLADILTSEQLAEYERAVNERVQFRRLANSECIVALLDERLNLNKDQRKEMIKTLTGWSGIQRLQPTFYFQNLAYIPQLPAETLKVLNPSQRKILDGMQQADFQVEMFDDGQVAIVISR